MFRWRSLCLKSHIFHDSILQSVGSNARCLRKEAVPAGPALIEPLNDDRRDHGENSPQKIHHPRNVRVLPRSRDFR